jgi:hypothetical protein
MNAPATQPSSAPITGGTTVALSLVVSIVIAALGVGGTTVIVQRLQSDVAALQSSREASVAVQNAQAVELATLKVELRTIRESQLRVEARLDALVQGRSGRAATSQNFTP